MDKVLYAKERGKDKGFYLNIKANFRIGDLVELDQVCIGSVYEVGVDRVVSKSPEEKSPEERVLSPS